VSPRVRVYSTVVLAAVGAAAGVVAITAATSNHPPKPLAPRAGKPPFASDWTAPPALAASVQRALAAWPRDTLSTLRSLAGEHPRSAFVHLNFGLALYWQRDDAGALAEWRKAKDVAPDTPSAVRAGDLLHPSTPPGLPQFQPTFARATTSVQLLLVRGMAPNDVDARVAAAVGRYDKDHPERAFSQLGPLTARFPDAQTVRFHLGLLSLWIGAFAEARRQLRLAVRDGPKTAFATEAKTLLARLGNVGTK
jgi:hypothetical protein